MSPTLLRRCRENSTLNRRSIAIGTRMNVDMMFTRYCRLSGIQYDIRYEMHNVRGGSISSTRQSIDCFVNTGLCGGSATAAINTSSW